MGMLIIDGEFSQRTTAELKELREAKKELDALKKLGVEKLAIWKEAQEELNRQEMSEEVKECVSFYVKKYSENIQHILKNNLSMGVLENAIELAIEAGMRIKHELNIERIEK